MNSQFAHTFANGLGFAWVAELQAANLGRYSRLSLAISKLPNPVLKLRRIFNLHHNVAYKLQISSPTVWPDRRVKISVCVATPSDLWSAGLLERKYSRASRTLDLLDIALSFGPILAAGLAVHKGSRGE